MVGDGIILGLISNNRYDAWGHAALAQGMLPIGFAIPQKPPLPNTTLLEPLR